MLSRYCLNSCEKKGEGSSNKQQINIFQTGSHTFETYVNSGRGRGRFYLFTVMIFSRKITDIPLQKYQPSHFPNAYALCTLNKQPSDPTIWVWFSPNRLSRHSGTYFLLCLIEFEMTVLLAVIFNLNLSTTAMLFHNHGIFTSLLGILISIFELNEGKKKISEILACLFMFLSSKILLYFNCQAESKGNFSH